MKRVPVIAGVVGGLCWAFLCYQNYHLDEAKDLLIKYQVGKAGKILAKLERIEPKIEKIMCHEEKGKRQRRAAELYSAINEVLSHRHGQVVLVPAV